VAGIFIAVKRKQPAKAFTLYQNPVVMRISTFFALVSLAILPIDSFSQSQCPAVDSLVNAIKKANYFKQHEYRTGFGEYGRDSQYMRATTLAICAKEDQLRTLLDNEHNIVALYGWLALMQHQPEEALRYLLKTPALKKRSVTEFLNSCQGDVEKAMADVMTDQFYAALLKRQITLSADSLIDFLNFKEERIREVARQHMSTPTGRF
jgi:hypothetical protein